MMVKFCVGVFLIIKMIIVYIYVYFKIKREQSFTESIINASDFYQQVSRYKGYVICAEKEMVINEPDLFRHILNSISKKEQCVLINLSNDFYGNHLDMKLIEALKINTIPSILYINNGIEIKEIVNFRHFPDDFTNKKIVKNIESLLG